MVKFVKLILEDFRVNFWYTRKRKIRFRRNMSLKKALTVLWLLVIYLYNLILSSTDKRAKGNFLKFFSELESCRVCWLFGIFVSVVKLLIAVTLVLKRVCYLTCVFVWNRVMFSKWSVFQTRNCLTIGSCTSQGTIFFDNFENAERVGKRLITLWCKRFFRDST